MAARRWWIVLPLCLVAAAPEAPSAADVAAAINQAGARDTVRQLVAGHQDASGMNDWTRVTSQIWHGNPAMIALAPALAEGTDAGMAEDLTISMAHALALAPAAVLQAIAGKTRPALRVKAVCGAPFVEGTVPDLAAELRAAHSAVSAVSQPDLQAVRGACLERLEASASEISHG
jgi:hypothetical protein